SNPNMERKAGKRSRSPNDDDTNNNITQTKVWVSQKMSDARDPAKMKEIHEKTTKMLFDGAANCGNENGNGQAENQNGSVAAGSEQEPQEGQRQDQEQQTEAVASANAPTTASATLYEHYQLLGDGTIMLRDMRPDTANPRLDRKKSRCCQRPTLIHALCVNCTMDLCEECGYSCGECYRFICRSCVTLFGNRPNESDDPLCERCQMFFA
ncbi:hypothetical protein KR074_009330, partial [Drosophila pseudoananassae]